MEPTLAIDPRLLEILACPACRTPLKLAGANTALECVHCRRAYPIRDGIPVLLAEEAVPVSD